jgi:hypothetical protein
MNTKRKSLYSYLIGLYVWILTVFCGMILLDIVYSRLIPQAATAQSTISDLLLLIWLVVFVLVILAILLSWKLHSVRTLFIVSLFFLLLELLIPLIFSRIGQTTIGYEIRPFFRIIPTGLASILSFAGMNKFSQKQ